MNYEKFIDQSIICIILNVNTYNLIYFCGRSILLNANYYLDKEFNQDKDNTIKNFLFAESKNIRLNGKRVDHKYPWFFGFWLWGPPWDPGDVFRMFFDDFFGRRGSFKPKKLFFNKIFYFWPLWGHLRGSQNWPQGALTRDKNKNFLDRG